jgi:hypothetical protein
MVEGGTDLVGFGAVSAWWRWTHLPKAGGVDGLGVILLTEIQVMHVESTARNADAFCNLIVLLQPRKVNAQWAKNVLPSPSKKVPFFLFFLWSKEGLRNSSLPPDGDTGTQEDNKTSCPRSCMELVSPSLSSWYCHWPGHIVAASGLPRLQKMM